MATVLLSSCRATTNTADCHPALSFPAAYKITSRDVHRFSTHQVLKAFFASKAQWLLSGVGGDPSCSTLWKVASVNR